MPYLLAGQRIADYEQRRHVFDSRAEAQRAAGLTVEKVTRNVEDPNDVFAWFEVTDRVKARAFVTSVDVPDAQARSGVIGEPEIVLLT